MKFMRPDTRILHRVRPTDRTDPAHAHTAVELDLPDGFSEKAKACWRYYEGAAYIFEYRDKLVVTDESLELATDGDGTNERPFCDVRWICDSWEQLEEYLELNYDDHLNDGVLDVLQYESTDRHIASLSSHGVRIKLPNGTTEPLSMEHYHKAVAYCKTEGASAVTYEIELPDIGEDFMIAFWKDGHVNSGSVDQIFRCLAR